jgi:hypothetical protein
VVLAVSRGALQPLPKAVWSCLEKGAEGREGHWEDLAAWQRAKAVDSRLAPQVAKRREPMEAWQQTQPMAG